MATHGHRGGLDRHDCDVFGADSQAAAVGGERELDVAVGGGRGARAWPFEPDAVRHLWRAFRARVKDMDGFTWIAGTAANGEAR